MGRMACPPEAERGCWVLGGWGRDARRGWQRGVGRGGESDCRGMGPPPGNSPPGPASRECLRAGGRATVPGTL